VAVGRVSDEVTQLAPGLWCLGQKKGGRVHAFLCEENGELTLVDTLFDTDGARILREIARIGRQPSDLRRIVLTHAHRSHLGGLAALKEATGATVYAHPWEADIIGGERKAQAVSIVPKRPLRVYFPFQFAASVGLGAHPPCPVDETVAGGDRIGPLHVLDAAGHSPGHLAFLWPERRTLIAGDSISTWPGGLAGGWGSFTLNERKHRATLRLLAEVEPEALGVGHGPPIPHGAAERVRGLVDALAR
jgi:glyoxylase-like metal-dependent hydrolase (beta-lactamase superfamily II)